MPNSIEPWSQTQEDGWCIYTISFGLYCLEDNRPADTEKQFVLDLAQGIAAHCKLPVQVVRVVAEGAVRELEVYQIGGGA